MKENKYSNSPTNFNIERNETSSNFSELLKKEQEHRHQWQDKYLKANTLSFRSGQIFGLIYNLALLYLVYDLIQSGEKSLAVKIFALNCALIAFALIVTSIERRTLSKKPPRRGSRDKNFRTRTRSERSDRNREERQDRDRRDRRRF